MCIRDRGKTSYIMCCWSHYRSCCKTPSVGGLSCLTHFNTSVLQKGLFKEDSKDSSPVSHGSIIQYSNAKIIVTTTYKIKKLND